MPDGQAPDGPVPDWAADWPAAERPGRRPGAGRPGAAPARGRRGVVVTPPFPGAGRAGHGRGPGTAGPPPVGGGGRIQVEPGRFGQALDADSHHAGEPARLAETLPNPADPACELAGVSRAQRGIAVGGRQHELVDRRRYSGHQRGRSRDIGVDVLVSDRDRSVAGERLAAGEQLEEHHPRRVHVRARARAVAGHLLGRQVGDGPDEQARPGVRGGRLRPGQAEVRHLQPAVGGQQDVLRLDVAVHDAGRVRGGQAVEHAGHDVQRRRRGEPAAFAEHLLERAPGHVFHGQVQKRPVGALVEDRDHVLVRQPRDRLGLADEPADELLVPGQLGVHDLERHLAVQPGVHGQVDGGHPAVRNARGYRVAPVQQAPGERVGQGIVHRDDFTVVWRMGRR